MHFSVWRALHQLSLDEAKFYVTILGLPLAALGLCLNAYALLKNLKSRKLSNYQELTKSHRDLWKLTLDKPTEFARLFSEELDLISSPPTYAEKRFIHLVLLHTTSAFYFAKHSDILEIEKLRYDIEDFLSYPLPRMVWSEYRRFFNKDFVKFVEHRRSRFRLLVRRFRRSLQTRMPPSYCRWKILLITGFRDKILETLNEFGDEVVCQEAADFTLSQDFVLQNEFDLIVVFGYNKIIKKDVLKIVPILNIHPGYLPYNRGPNPNLWSILDDSNRGVTVHFMDAGIDSGDIIAQRRAPLSERDTTVRQAFINIITESASLFREVWPFIRAGKFTRTPQTEVGTSHSFRDQIPLESLMTDEALDLPIAEFRERATQLTRSSCETHADQT